MYVYTVLWLCQLPGYDNYGEGSTLTWSSSHERFTVSNVESQVFTPNNSRLPALGSNAGGPRPKRAPYHWTTAPLCKSDSRYSDDRDGLSPINFPKSTKTQRNKDRMRQRTVVVVLFLRTFSCVYPRNSPLAVVVHVNVYGHTRLLI